MEKTLVIEATKDEVALLTSALEECLKEMNLAQERIRADQHEIDKLSLATRANLSSIRQQLDELCGNKFMI